MLETGSCWRPASPPGLTGARGSAPSKLGASGRAAPEPRRPFNQSICRPAPATGPELPRLSRSHGDLARSRAASATERVAGPTQAERGRREEKPRPGAEEE